MRGFATSDEVSLQLWILSLERFRRFHETLSECLNKLALYLKKKFFRAFNVERK